MKKIINTLILSGGGVKGIAYIGALKYLDELKTKENYSTIYLPTTICSKISEAQQI